MTQVRRPLGGAVGDDPDPTPPEIRRDAALPLDRPDDELYDDAELYDVGAYAKLPFRERMGELRKRLLPLPDEVVHEYLGDDEYVIHTDHPSFRAFLIQNAIQVGLLTIAGIGFLILARVGINWTTLAVFLVVDIVFAILALKRLSDRYISYVITNLRLIRVSGIISRKIASIPWTRMTGIGYKQTAMGRILGYASIHLESANEESGLREFSDINDPATFHQHLLNMVSAKTGQSSDKGLPPPPTKGVRKSFMQRRRERRETMERAAQFQLERERQARDRRRRGAGSAAAPGDDVEIDEDLSDPDALADRETRPSPRPAPRDRGGAAEGLPTPEANAPDHRPAMPPGRRARAGPGPSQRRRPGPDRPRGEPRPRPQKRRIEAETEGEGEEAGDVGMSERRRDRPRSAGPPGEDRDGRARSGGGGDQSAGDSDARDAVWRPAPEKGRRAPVKGRPQQSTPPGRPLPKARRQGPPGGRAAPSARPSTTERPAPKAKPPRPPIVPEVIDVSARTGPADVETGADEGVASSARRPRRFWPGADQGEAPAAKTGARRGLKLPLLGRRPPPNVPPPEGQRRPEAQEDSESLGGLSARDALGSVRKSSRQQPPKKARPTRARRPSFGRSARPEAPAEPAAPPEPRELPPAPADHADTPDDDDPTEEL